MRSTPADLLALAMICTVGACSLLAGVWLGMSPVPDATISPPPIARNYFASPVSSLPTVTPTAFVPVTKTTGVVRIQCAVRSRTPFCQSPNAYHGSLGETGSANS